MGRRTSGSGPRYRRSTHVIDLHTHSTASDGTDPPERIAELAAAARCSAVALTDHDTLVGLAAARAGRTSSGWSWSPAARSPARSPGPAPTCSCTSSRTRRGPCRTSWPACGTTGWRRNRRLAERLVELGIPITYEEAVAEATSEESLGRPHFAAAARAARGPPSRSPTPSTAGWPRAGRLTCPRPGSPPAEIAAAARASGGGVRAGPPLHPGAARPTSSTGRSASWPRPGSRASRPSTRSYPPDAAPGAGRPGPAPRPGGHRRLGLPRHGQARPVGRDRARRPQGPRRRARARLAAPAPGLGARRSPSLAQGARQDRVRPAGPVGGRRAGRPGRDDRSVAAGPAERRWPATPAPTAPGQHLVRPVGGHHDP